MNMPRLGLLLLAAVNLPVWANAIAPYEQLNWVLREQLPAEHQARLPSFCSGDYLEPTLSVRTDNAIDVTSKQAQFTEQQGATFSGDVKLHQQDKHISANQLQYNQQTGNAHFEGQIVFQDKQISMFADELSYNSQTGQSELNNAHYVITPLHMRGTANSITIQQDQQANLSQATYTFCEPGHNDWDIKASEINLNQQEGYGEAYHGRLRIKEIPVMYLPYYRFPIGPDRLTGFLNPEISLSASSKKGSPFEDVNVTVNQFATPFYFNIASNYDDTFTPRYIKDHGVLAENEFRYLNVLGEGALSMSYLGNDDASKLDPITEVDDYRQPERWSKSLHHTGTVGQHWSNRIAYDEVSDLNYVDDFRRAGLINRASHLKQNAEAEYNNGQWQLLTRLERYQTIDENIADSAKPFHRLPQVQLKRINPISIDTFNYEFSAEATRFTRDNNGLTGVRKMDGERLHTDLVLNYPFETNWGFIKPSIELMHTQYSFQNLDTTAQLNGYQTEVDRSVSISQIDSGLYFERNVQLFSQSFLQTLEPRLMLAYIPYVDQSQIPLFDTTQTSFSYSQLFNPNRFTGHDRVGDTKQISLGLTTRFMNDTGLEVFRASIGQVHYLADRKVELAPGDTTLEDTDLLDSSALGAEMQWLFANNWRSRIDIQYNTHATNQEEPIEKASAQLNYKSEHDFMFDMNFSHVEATKQKQVGIAFFVPLNDSWAFYAQKKHDIWPYTEAAKQAKEDDNLLNIEGLVGIEYQNCCWRAQFTYEEHTLSDSTKDYQFLMQIHLKGLGILGSDSESILSDRIYGYDQRTIHDY